MESVKTYKNVNKRDKKLSFGISKMEEIYDKRKGKKDDPHRHDYFTLVFTEKAKGEHKVDFRSYPLSGQQIYFISPGQVHQIIEEEKSFGFAIVFSYDFLLLNNIPLTFIEDLNLFNDFSETPPLEPNESDFITIQKYLSEMYTIFHSEMSYKQEAIGALLKLVLILCNNVCSLPQEDINTVNTIFRKFKQLINQHYKTDHHTNFYAELLHISPDHLNKVVKQNSGKSAKEHIQSRIIIAAKRMIYFSSLSNKEIGHELGFSEPANFSAFFKKCVGVSPSQFRKMG
ncbi:helix-turn-helix domain-containing protein [Flammeovirga sp. EKP202]|uniref:helix-turn-helix domain-containing protein n=1 Tax=Flammeovirga sp. EKP202 TaxID=2770592 RepID=UPI00165F68F4|nr:helix-turn-helix domain-containing protein [Flammeovirga sp. EKP202]MBD0403525.1 helix-turn-helix domain-containing protein [Flammeovirga sp. EKP202]